MRNILFAVLVVFIFSGAHAQSLSDTVARAGDTCLRHSFLRLSSYNKERLRLNKNAVLVFSSWSVLNVVTGAIWQGRTEGTAEYFHRMNLMVGSINLALGAAAYWSLSRKRTDLDWAGSLKEQANVEKIFLLNAGLDVGYMVGGLYTIEKSHHETDADEIAKYKGWGQSFIVQGGFLLVFDCTMFLLQNRHGRQLYKSLGSPQFSPRGAVVSWNF